jgi:hypothetical protein
MLKTFCNSSMCRIVILYATLLTQQHLSFANDEVPSTANPSKSFPSVDAISEKMSDVFGRVAQQAQPSLVRIQPLKDGSSTTLPFAIPIELTGTDSSSVDSGGTRSKLVETAKSASHGGTGVIVTDDG